jgi:hypothetical protein
MDDEKMSLLMMAVHIEPLEQRLKFVAILEHYFKASSLDDFT